MTRNKRDGPGWPVMSQAFFSSWLSEWVIEELRHPSSSENVAVKVAEWFPSVKGCPVADSVRVKR